MRLCSRGKQPRPLARPSCMHRRKSSRPALPCTLSLTDFLEPQAVRRRPASEPQPGPKPLPIARNLHILSANQMGTWQRATSTAEFVCTCFLICRTDRAAPAAPAAAAAATSRARPVRLLHTLGRMCVVEHSTKPKGWARPCYFCRIGGAQLVASPPVTPDRPSIRALEPISGLFPESPIWRRFIPIFWTQLLLIVRSTRRFR